MQSFEQRDPKGEKLYKKPEYIKPPPSDKQKLSQTTKKLESITEIVDLERESLIKTIEKLKNKANIVELILNHGSLTGKMILKNGIIIDVSLDEYTEIEAIIYLIQITEEDLLSYLPMFLRKKLEEENLLDTLESIIKYRPRDIKFEIEMEDTSEQKKTNEDIPKKQEYTVSLDDLDKEIEALLLEIDKKEILQQKDIQTPPQEIEEIKEEQIFEIEDIQSQEENIENSEEIIEETSEKEYEEQTLQSTESTSENSEEYLQVKEISEQIPELEQTQIEQTEEKIEEIFYIEQKEETPEEQIEVIHKEEEPIEKDMVEEISQAEQNIEEHKELLEYKQEKLEVNKEPEPSSENKITIQKENYNIDQFQIKSKEEKVTMVINNIVNKLSQIPPLEEFHIMNTETEELEYSSNESLDDFSISTIIASYKDLSMFSSFSSEKINNIVLETNNFYYIITNIDDTKILLSKCSKKSNPSLISSLISKAVRTR